MYKVNFLGGIGEIGRNMTVLEMSTGLYIIDCGAGLCEGNTVYPDMSCLQQRADEIKALIITHGHDDHIGGIGVFNARFPRVPIYSSPFTLELIKKRFKLSRTTHLIPQLAGQPFDVGDVTFEFIHVNHSIPQAYAVYIKTKDEKLLFSGDFKIDLLNSDEPPTDLKRIRQIGEAGLDALFIETTNAAKPGHSRSTEIVKHGLDDIFRTYSNERLVFSLFSSNVQRMNIILDLALRYNRKVFFYGKSMQDVISVARKLNLLHDIPFLIEDINDVYMYPDNEVVIVTTGGQGEGNSGLYKLCSNYNAPTMLGTNDVVVFSASIIPGNEQAIGSLKSKLEQNGCLCVDNTSHITHCSGHGNTSDLLMFISAANPECIIPIHGYFRYMAILNNKILARGKIKARYKQPLLGTSILKSDSFFDEQYAPGITIRYNDISEEVLLNKNCKLPFKPLYWLQNVQYTWSIAARPSMPVYFDASVPLYSMDFSANFCNYENYKWSIISSLSKPIIVDNSAILLFQEIVESLTSQNKDIYLKEVLSHEGIDGKVFSENSKHVKAFEDLDLSCFDETTEQIIDEQISRLHDKSMMQAIVSYESAPTVVDNAIKNRPDNQVKNLANDDVMQLMLNKATVSEPSKSNKADLLASDKQICESHDDLTLSKATENAQESTTQVPIKPVKQEKNILKDRDKKSVEAKLRELFSNIKSTSPQINKQSETLENSACSSNKQSEEETVSNLKANQPTINQNGKKPKKDNIMEFLINSNASIQKDVGVKAPAKCIGGHNYYRYSSQELYDSNSELEDFFEEIDDNKR